MRAIGIDDIELAELLPTVLPADEMRADTVWRMADGRIFHLEFQNHREPTLYRFLSYDTRLAEKYQTPVRTVILYHGAVSQAPTQIDLGVIRYQIENVYLSQLDGDAALEVVAQHLSAHTWEPPDRLRLALALCMHTEDRRALFGQTLALLPQVPLSERDLVTAAIMALAESRLTDEELDRLTKELTKMSKILQRVQKEGRLEGRIEGREEERRLVAKALLAAGDSVEKVMAITGLTRPEVDALQAQ
ncbi:MAG: hypothetical protein C7B45_09900 [Sulfobacillus acidophilus]|uniref:Transposase (putative) YhgA-like domain-containing protein n=1 Tax=Sulfobacillus acidophilus TaxID=53633 RepID=A0A2T2WHI9_9FIRM|nr:MAG: hypothetical protein C7B45_09900 [Sulfobacillus acidophilus]